MLDITSEELKKRLDAGEDLIVIDVREPYEYEAFNIGVENIPLGQINLAIEQLGNYRNREIVVLCRSGMRSGQAKMFLLGNGFSNVRNLIGGMLDWQAKFA
ncbi:MAG: rhodanese-like domain-containing protein [Chitinophagales bacterium]|jgi:rhodanese-related sulfurtransferase|nr:rhodanese-like domain-containing protein [Chitinophagales bacterium]